MRLSTEVYASSKKDFLRRMKMSEGMFVNMLKGDFKDGLDKCTGRMSNMLMFTSKLDPLKIIDLWEYLWYYKRNLHIVYSVPDDITLGSSVDTTILNMLDMDMDIDTTIGDKRVYIHLSNRKYPYYVEGSSLKYTATIYDETHRKTSISFSIEENCTYVYINDMPICKSCKQCDSDGDEYTRVIRKASVNNNDNAKCLCQRNGWVIEQVMFIILDVVTQYVNRGKSKRSKRNSIRNVGTTMVSTDNRDDTERVLSLEEYAYQYEGSPKYEYKGGHHASPVCHRRRGYYRKSNRGSYNLVAGEFIKVQKGTGRFTYVESTIVNAHLDTTIAEMI